METLSEKEHYEEDYMRYIVTVLGYKIASTKVLRTQSDLLIVLSGFFQLGTREKEPHMPSLEYLWACLGGILIIVNWSGKAYIIVGGIISVQVIFLSKPGRPSQ